MQIQGASCQHYSLIYHLKEFWYIGFVKGGRIRCGKLSGGVNRMLSRRYSVYISPSAQIGTGLLLPHCFSIMISTSKIGNNVTILQQVTIGSERGGKHPGFPTIGDNVFIACGAKVLGGIKVGNNVVIGANAVVIRDVPDNAVVGGVPAKILDYEGERHVEHWCKDLRDYHKN